MNIGKLMEYQYDLSAKPITRYKLLKALVLFRKNILRHVPNGYSIGLQLKVKMDTDYRSISGYSVIKLAPPQGVGEFLKLLPNWLISLDLRSDTYNQYGVDAIVIAYFIIPKAKKSKISKPRLLPAQRGLTHKDIPRIKFGGYNLPSTMDLYKWGQVQFILNDAEAVVYHYKGIGEIHVKFTKNISNVEL